MEKAELKAILWQARRLQFSKRSMLDKMAELEYMIQKCTATYGGVVVSGGDNGSRIEQGVARLLDYRAKCAEAFGEYAERQEEARRLIGLVEDAIARRVLECRYLFGMNWYQTADEVHYSRTYVTRLHGMGIMQILQAVNSR